MVDIEVITAPVAQPVLSVCICTLPARAALLSRLLAGLLPQAAGKPVEILLVRDAGAPVMSGVKRHAVSVASCGEYLTFVDDDDEVAATYVADLLAGCEQRPDVVTFDLLRDDDRGRTERQRFLLAGQDHQFKSSVRIMTANHLCAWRRDIQRLVAFPPNLGYGDDCLWYKPLIASGIPQTEVHLDAALYFYHWSRTGTVNQRAASRHAAMRWARGGIECFRQDRQLFIATKSRHLTQRQARVECRDNNNEICRIWRARCPRYFLFTAR